MIFSHVLVGATHEKNKFRLRTFVGQKFLMVQCNLIHTPARYLYSVATPEWYNNTVYNIDTVWQHQHSTVIQCIILILCDKNNTVQLCTTGYV